MSKSPEALKSLSDWANSKVHEWLSLMDAEDFVAAAELTIAAIQKHCRSVDESASPVVRQFHFGIRVVLNGLRDLANIKIIVGDDRWIASPKSIERVWNLAHDARDRLSGYSGLDSDFLASCLDEIVPLLDTINQRYGNGLYTSWEILWDYLKCSICESDSRGCEHVPGDWYNDRECVLYPEGPHPVAVAIVEHPRDPRCRIWPWLKRRNESNHFVIEDIPIFIIFKPEGDEDGGDVVDRDELIGVV
jgi:hypothetical protein